MSDVFIHGVGAVSPAGWGATALRAAVASGAALPVEMLARPGWERKLAVRAVPPPAMRPAFMGHPRLRRAGVIAQHTMASALEALGADVARVQAGELRLGIIVSTIAGGVSYSRRFYEEVLREPGIASPLIFPETVFNAPASHLAAYLNSAGINYSLVGDDGTFLQGLALAADWLDQGLVDSCVVAGTEELDWIVADAVRLFQRSAVYTGGAGALYLKKNASDTRLSAITDPYPYTKLHNRTAAIREVRRQLGEGAAEELLCDSETNGDGWIDWPGRRLTPKAVLGEAFNAFAAWQCVIACEAIREKKFARATVSIAGANQQAIGARFSRSDA